MSLNVDASELVSPRFFLNLQKLANKFVRGILPQFGGRTNLLDATLVENHHAIGQFKRLVLIVRHEKRSQMRLVVKMTQPFAQILTHLGIKRTERLVEQKNTRLHRKGPRQGHPLALTTGKLRRQPFLITFQLDHLQEIADPLRDRLAIGTFASRQHPQTKSDILKNCHVLEKCVGLKNESRLTGIGAFLGHLLTGKENLSRVRDFQSRNNSQQGRLTAPARPQQGKQFAGLHFQGNIAQRWHGPLATGLKTLGNMGNSDAHVD